MQKEIYHCFSFGEKRELRKEGIKVKKIRGKEMSYLLDIPDWMICKCQGPLGGTKYDIRKNGYYLGYVYGESLCWTPGYDLNCIIK